MHVVADPAHQVHVDEQTWQDDVSRLKKVPLGQALMQDEPYATRPSAQAAQVVAEPTQEAHCEAQGAHCAPLMNVLEGHAETHEPPLM